MKIHYIDIIIVIILILFCGCDKSTSKNEDSPQIEQFQAKNNIEKPLYDTAPQAEDKEKFISGEYVYTLREDGICIERYLGEDIDVIIPDQINGMIVKELKKDAFYQKKTMKSVVIPSSVTALTDSPFYRCYSLEKVYLSENIQEINVNPFFRCLSLTEIKVAENNPYFCDVDGVLYNKEKTVLVVYPEGKEGEIYEILLGVKEIDDAFGYDSLVQRLYIPPSVEKFPTNTIDLRPEEMVLVVEAKSAAMDYAIRNGYKYEVIDNKE